jgi:DNA polymerase III epsilon subunit-like protein
MLIVFKGIKQEYVYIADTEYDKTELIQSAGLVFQRVDERNDIYQLAFSFNYYIKKPKLNWYVQKYTGITSAFLKEHGLTEEEFLTVYNGMFEDVDPNNTLFVSHGSQADKKVIKEAKVAFIPEHSYCTYKAAKRILKKEDKLTLGDVAKDAGFMLQNTHDAYADAVATAFIFSFLKKLEWQNS